jgi:hypothetical protein
MTDAPPGAVALWLDMKRQSGLRSVKARDGWAPWTQDVLERTNLIDRGQRYRARRYLSVTADAIEVRRLNTYGNKLEYRLRPGWPAPRAEVIDLTAARKARKRKS